MQYHQVVGTFAQVLIEREYLSCVKVYCRNLRVCQSPNHEYGQMGNFKVYTTKFKWSNCSFCL